MPDILLSAMIAPDNQTTYCVGDGTPYRGGDKNLVYARPEHVGQLTAAGFVLATNATVTSGNPLLLDPGWPETNPN